MALAQELPTEILCAIFEQSILHPTEGSSATSTATEPQSPTPLGPSPTEPNKFCAIPASYKDPLAQSIILSQVCVRWRDIAIDLQSLWTRIHLGPNAFVSQDNNDTVATEMTDNILSRSGRLSLFLDVSFTLKDPISYARKVRYETNIRHSLLPHVERCLTLRLVSNDIIIAAVLDVFLEHNLSSPLKNSVLSELHLEQTVPTNHTQLSGHCLVTFPTDLSVIAPYLKTLYVKGSQVALFPRWRLRILSLNDIFISYRNHFHLFMKTSMTKLVLHRVTIPGGEPYVSRITSNYLPTLTSLTLSELRCSGPEDDHQNMYTLFFVCSIYSSLQELELSGLSRDAMVGLYVMLRVNSTMVLDQLRALTLRKVKLDVVLTTAITVSFPVVESLILDRVDGGSKLVFDVWRKRREVWPQLSEITLDAEIVGRD